MKKYQVAIIGTNIGAKHYEDFQKVKERFNVHTLCGLTREAIDNILSNDTETKVSLNFDEVLKVKERSRERLKIINQLTEENKELRIQNKFLVDRLEVWAERNFEERQKSLNMTVDDVVAQYKHKQDFKKEQELAKTVDEVNERQKNLDGQGLGKKE